MIVDLPGAAVKRPAYMLILLVCVGYSRPSPSAQAMAKSRRRPNTPIKHFMFLMQENHSFDNYFGTYPGADGIPKGTCMPVGPTEPKGGCVKPSAHRRARAWCRLGNRSIDNPIRSRPSRSRSMAGR